MEFEWDARKAAQNVREHGVTFEAATHAFDDPDLVLAEDAAHSQSEQRYFAFGRVNRGILTVRFVIRDDRIRIIGAGYWRKGKVFYEQANRLQR